MENLNEIRDKFNKYSDEISYVKNCFNIDEIKKKMAFLTAKQNDDNFWNDKQEALKIINDLKNINDIFQRLTELEKDYKDLQIVFKENDDDLLFLANDIFKKVAVNVEVLKKKILLSGEYDKFDAILTIHSGAGGIEATDWANMIFRMYVRYIEKNNFKMKIINIQYGDNQGLKSVILKVTGDFAYGLLKSERGVHRLIRISPFDPGKKRHTSFASVNVVPDFGDIEININEDDLKMSAFRSGGAGGQNVNKVSSAVRIVHIPTGITVSCQTERSQLMNKNNCYEMLKNLLYQREIEKKQKKIDKITGVQKDIEWGSQIRSYVFCPYTLVKDHRTNFENCNIKEVMDGELEGFVYSYLKKITEEKKNVL